MKFQQGIPSFRFLLVISLFVTFVDAGIVSDSLRSKLRKEEKCNAILELKPVLKSVLSNPVLNFLTREERTSKILNLVQEATDLLQAPFIAAIHKLGFGENAEAFWIANKIVIRNVDLKFVNEFSSHPGEFDLRLPAKVNLNGTIRSEITESRNTTKSSKDTLTPEWGVQRIEADVLWRSGILGQDVLVAGIDTGVLQEHEVFAGNPAKGWFDAISKKKKPYDDNGHGTHTMGTIVGQLGVGVAPNASWIACKGLAANGGGSEEDLMACAQFVAKFKPTPKVVSNSWGGGQGVTFFNGEINTWRAAGIVPIFSIGNSGSGGCDTANSPGDQKNLISVGATDINDKIASFSSRGYAKGTPQRIKPEVSAPGVAVRSAYNGGPKSYGTFSGTSMAAPHVAGSVALMLCGNPYLKFQQIAERLEETVYKPQLTEDELKCGVDNGNGQNNVYGFGRINVRAAMYYEAEPTP